MKYLYKLLYLLPVICLLSSCKPVEEPDAIPQITSLTAEDVTYNSARIKIETDIATEYGYIVEKLSESEKTPEAQEVFASATGSINETGSIELNDLEQETYYIVYVAVRKNDLFSTVEKVEFKTLKEGTGEDPELPKNDVIEMNEIGTDYFSFTIKYPGQSYIFSPIEKVMWNMGGFTEEDYLTTFGISGYGEVQYDWVNGGVYNGVYDMSVAPDREYIIFVVTCDESNNITGEVQKLEFRTKANAVSEAGINVTLSEITNNSVRIHAEPDDSIDEYYVYVRDKAWFDFIILENGGESMLIQLIKYPSANAKLYFGEVSDDVWSGLYPDTDYCCAVVGIDKTGAETLIIKDFRTGASVEKPSVVEIIANDSEISHETIQFTLKADVAKQMRYAFMTTADVEAYLSEGKTIENVINDKGIDLDESERFDATGSGFNVRFDDLWPETDYTIIAAARNTENTTTIEDIEITTKSKPVPSRVESDLFDILPGTWEVSYSYIDYKKEEVSISTSNNTRVTIVAGPDYVSSVKYREQNQLVILNWPIQQVSSGYQSPADLIAADYYWASHQSLAYRDYGPKIVLEIGRNDEVTVPTAVNRYLFNWGQSGVYNFFGMDYNANSVDLTAFPVEVSADKNTLTIKGVNNYRPAVFVYETALYNVATTDIVLTRVK